MDIAWDRRTGAIWVRELTAITMTNDNDRHESARLDRLLGNAFVLFSADECLMQGKTTRVQHEHLWSQNMTRWSRTAGCSHATFHRTTSDRARFSFGKLWN